MMTLKTYITAFIAICLIATYGVRDTRGSDVMPRPYVEGEVLIKYKEHTSRAAQDLHSTQFGARTLREFRSIDLHHLRLPSGVSVEEGMEMFRRNPDVEYVEPNYIRRATATPDDTHFSLQWGLHNTSYSSTDVDIDAPEAWDASVGSGAVVVGILDTGVDYDHPDLKANIWINPSDPQDGIDNDSNGYVDDIRGWDFVDNDNTPTDPNSHGTFVAGAIGAVGNNSRGVAGVSWTVKLMPLRIFDAQSIGSVSDIVAAINYARRNGANIINASFEGTSYSQAEKSAIDAFGAAGGLFVVAAGNSGTNNDSSPVYPASYPCANIIAVAATTPTDDLASFSNYGKSGVDVGAPGQNILSTEPGSTYRYMSGTSAAAPFVTGTAALIKAKYPALTGQQLKEYILSSADAVPSLAGKVASGGRLNASAALSIVPRQAASASGSSGGGGGGCFIATAAYGDPSHPDIDVLRDVRDKHMLTNAPGRIFVSLYYKYSPPMAEYISGKPATRFVIRLALGFLVFLIVHPSLGFLPLAAIACCLWIYQKKTRLNRISPVRPGE